MSIAEYQFISNLKTLYKRRRREGKHVDGPKDVKSLAFLTSLNNLFQFVQLCIFGKGLHRICCLFMGYYRNCNSLKFMITSGRLIMIDCKTLGVFFILKLFIHSRTRVSTLIELEWYGQTGVVVGIFIVV